MNLSGYVEELKKLGKPGPGFKPHRHILLLAVMQLIREGKIKHGRVLFDANLRHEFTRLLEKHGTSEDRDRPWNPFFHLSVVSFWRLISTKGHENELTNTPRLGGPGDLQRMIQYAALEEGFVRLVSHKDLADAFEAALLNCIALGRQTHSSDRAPTAKQAQKSLQRLFLAPDSQSDGNPFVAYLNSLQRLNGSNENALAEYQACNPLFAHLHVPHPLTKVILEELRASHGRQVILTGHAGDGKSTIAVDVFKQLQNIPDDQPLSAPLRPREDLASGKITILKDLSERSRRDDATLMQEVFGGARRFLIVSNTGALLDLFRSYAPQCGLSEVKMESDILTAISNEQGQSTLTVAQTEFLVINLARIDNLQIARSLFEKMVDPARWQACADLACRANCPIYLNVELINRRHKLVFERLFLAYRRMYEYGTRLTLRQLTEHLAYMVTSGLEEIDLEEMRRRQVAPLKAEFMFFNRFFGDNGKQDHHAALQMRAVREIRRQRFGQRPCPSWERKLWLKLPEQNFELGVAECESEFGLLRYHGSGPGTDSRPGLSPDQAREQVRRMLFFLYDFSETETSYLVQFLNSPSILRWQLWQTPDAALQMTEKSLLEQRIFHVLQEHFTGVRLPEGAKGQERRLYITLSRGKSEIRQSAQVVVAQVDWSSETRLELVRQPNAVGGLRTDIELRGTGRIQGARLLLTLPFLDYVLMRHVGEAGEVLQPAYVERLERFKAQVQDLAKETQAHVMLVRLKTDNTFRRQQYTVSNGKLEVNDVL